MRTFSLLKGLPVYIKETGKELGVLSDMLLSPEGNIESIVVDVKGLFVRDRHILVDDVTSFGNDGVMISFDPGSNTHFNKDGHYLCHHNGLIGQLLYTMEGEKLGVLEDVYFDEKMGTILGYEVSEGFFADLSEGKTIVKTNKPLQFGEDIVLIEIDT